MGNDPKLLISDPPPPPSAFLHSLVGNTYWNFPKKIKNFPRKGFRVPPPPRSRCRGKMELICWGAVATKRIRFFWPVFLQFLFFCLFFGYFLDFWVFLFCSWQTWLQFSASFCGGGAVVLVISTVSMIPADPASGPLVCGCLSCLRRFLAFSRKAPDCKR